MSSNYDEEEEELDETTGGDDDDWKDDLEKSKQKFEEARDKYNEQKGNKNAPDKKSGQEATKKGSKEASKKGSKEATKKGGEEAVKKGGKEAAQKGGKEVAKKGAQEVTKKAGQQVAKEGVKQAAIHGTTQVATTAATTAGTAAAAGGATVAAGGAIAAQAAIPVAGWIALAIEAAILLMVGLFKLRKKIDKKLEEKGIDAKGMRRLLRAAPILMPLSLVFLVVMLIVLLMQAQTADRTQFMIDALKCFEENGGYGEDKTTNKCIDFYGSNIIKNSGIAFIDNARFGRYIGNTESPLIKKTDWQILMFVAEYLGTELLVFGENGVDFSIMDQVANSITPEDHIDESDKGGVVSKMLECLGDILKVTMKIVDPLGIVDKTTDFVQEGWYLFKWCKMEKKIFNNIVWGSVTVNVDTGTGLAQLVNRTVDRVALGIIETDPSEWLSKSRHNDCVLKSGIDFDITTGYLRIPGTAVKNVFKCGVTLDQAIELTKEYIPSFIEIYATYAATGDYKQADKVYDYYVKNMRKDKPLELRLVTYEKYTVEYTNRYNLNEQIVYKKTNSNGTWNDTNIGKDGFNEIKDAIKAEQKWWKKIAQGIKNACTKFINNVVQAVDALLKELRALMGFDVDISREYLTVVEKGAAYEYITENYYKTYVDKYYVERPDVVERQPSVGPNSRYPGGSNEFIELKWEETQEYTDENGKKQTKVVKSDEWKMAIRCDAVATYNAEHIIYQHALEQLPESKMIIFGENEETKDTTNRYEWILKQIDKDEAERAKREPTSSFISAEDAALALDVINAYYNNTFGLIAGASASNFDAAGPINESVAKFAAQFEGKKLAYMRSIDDTNTFINDEWCAMFVSYCMKKAGVGVPKFLGCSSFWAKYKNYTGFYDIRDSYHNNNITTNSAHIVANHSNIKPGDILLFRWKDARTARSHTGICKSITKDAYGNVTSIKVVEGNTGTGGYSRTKVSINTYTGNNIKYIVSFVDIKKVKDIGGWK